MLLESEASRSLWDPDPKAGEREIQAMIKAQQERLASEALMKAHFCRVSIWMFYLPITPTQRLIMGRIYGFSCAGSEFRMSYGALAKEFGSDRDNIRHLIGDLVEKGFLTKRTNGPRSPATYAVDVLNCYRGALSSGWGGNTG